MPSGPKNPGKRYNDRDTGAGAADSLDYGATGGGGAEEYAHEWDSRERSPDRASRRSGRSRREGTHDHDGANGDSRTATTSSRSKRQDDWDDDTASQSSTGGRRRQKSSPREITGRIANRRPPIETAIADREREREKEREREARSQARSERRAGRDVAEDVVIPTGPAAGVGKGSRKRMRAG